ncbi:MAG: beta-phosphoglucomutase [Bdellovibrionota bacterium]
MNSPENDLHSPHDNDAEGSCVSRTFGGKLLCPLSWSIEERNLSRDAISHHESLFCVGNGFLGVRGFFEEGYEENLSTHTVRSLYLNGFHDTAPIHYPEVGYGWAKVHEAMLSVAHPVNANIRINGERVFVDVDGEHEYVRTLDFRTGCLTRSFIYTTAAGNRFRLEFRRIASLVRQHVLYTGLTITALDEPGSVEIATRIETPVEHHADPDDPRVGAGDASMGACIERLQHEEGVFLLQQRTAHSDRLLATAIAQSLAGNPAMFVVAEDLRAQDVSFEVAPDAPVTLETFAAYYYSSMHVPSSAQCREDLVVQAQTECLRARQDGGRRLLEEQEHYLSQFWSECDVQIDGDVVLQQGVRFALFQLLQSVGRDGKTNVAAKGLTGEGYGGHYFWDTEIYVLPFFTWTKPEIARALLHYRFTILPGARKRAAELGHEGALYPWRTISGEEVSSFFPAGTAQYHINADIAFAILQYVEVTEDQKLLADFGAEMLFEIARFFVSLGSEIPGKGYCFHCVTGPDEYTACVDNNAYTNAMIQRALEGAVAAYETLRESFSGKLNELQRVLSLSGDEVARWSEIAASIYIPECDELGIIAQDDTFLSKPHWDFEGTPKDKHPLLLHYHYLNIYRHQVLKQADTLMLMYLMPERYSRALTRRCFHYYEPLTTHDSSLSPAVHSAIAANISEMDFATEYFLKTARLDLDNTCGNTKDGLHIASLAGSWGALFYGFLGVHMREGVLSFRPEMPEAWGTVRVHFQFRGRSLEVEVAHEVITYRLLSGEPIEIRHFFETVTLPAEGAVEISLAPSLKAVLFDLDGVITDTAEYHYRGWKALADELGIAFDREKNEALKGVSRMDSLNRILGERAGEYSPAEKAALAKKKNDYYLKLLEELDESAILPGVKNLLEELKSAGIKTAIASSSKNAPAILSQLGIESLFDAIADGNNVQVSKPDPEVFLLAAEQLRIRPCDCLGVEDAEAGITAIQAAGMRSLGVSVENNLPGATRTVRDLTNETLYSLTSLFAVSELTKAA